MNDHQTLLTEIQRLDKEASPGPWEVTQGSVAKPPQYDVIGQDGIHVASACCDYSGAVLEHADAELIALARTALPQLAAALQAVAEDCQQIVKSIDQQTLKGRATKGIRVQALTTLEIIKTHLKGKE